MKSNFARCVTTFTHRDVDGNETYSTTLNRWWFVLHDQAMESSGLWNPQFHGPISNRTKGRQEILNLLPLWSS